MIRYLLVALLSNNILAQDPVGDSQPQRSECNVCLDAAFYITKPDVEIYTGQANKMWKCREFEIMALNGEFGRDVCSIVQGYALRDCGCDDGKGSPPPEQPVIDFGAICNVCGGEGGSDFDQVTNPGQLVDTGVGISVECGSLYNFGFQGAFTAAQCPTIQKTVRAPCGCGSLGQPPPTAVQATEPPPSPTYPPPTPTTAPPTESQATLAPPTELQATPAPTISAAVATPPPIESQATPTPTVSATVVTTTAPTPFPTAHSTAVPLPPPTTQPPTIAPTQQTPPTYLVTASFPTAPVPTTTAPVTTTNPTAEPTTMPTAEPTNEPTMTPCSESGEACDAHSDCCLGLCDFGICSIEVLTLTAPVTSSERSNSVALLALLTSVAIALIL